MPYYDYTCKQCLDTETRLVAYDDRELSTACECGYMKEYVFPMGFSLQIFEPRHDDGLGCDVSGPRERKQIMKSLGLQEAGDPVGGTRQMDEKHMVKIGAPTGVKYSDMQRMRERGRIDKENTIVHMQNKDGSETSLRHGDTGKDVKKSIKTVTN